jgi:ATP-dependent RNA helicase DeaD
VASGRSLAYVARGLHPGRHVTTTDSTDADQDVAFSTFELDERILSAVETLGFDAATPIQAVSIPALLAGRDIVGRARTGSGKTAAFGLPLLQIVGADRGVGGLVLAPTRELAVQVAKALRSYAQFHGAKVATVYGGTPYGPQLRAIHSASIVVGTPGRVLDHIKRGSLDLSGVKMAVLDEADEMLRMGFVDDVEAILQATPATRQTALFSATMPDRIRQLASVHLRNPFEAQVEDKELTVEHIAQRWMRVPNAHKLEALTRVLAAEQSDGALVFARTRLSCAEVADELARRGMRVDALHGDLAQAARERVLHRLRAKALDVVVATDVAARGLDVEHLTHVINLDVPPDVESYVHRIGRTGRAGREGVAITFCSSREYRRLREHERALKVKIELAQVPSTAHIARVQRQRLIDELKTGSATDREHAVAWIDELVESGELSARDVAAAALAALAAARLVPLRLPEDDQPPSWSVPRERPRRDRLPEPGVDTNEVQVFIPVGHLVGVRPQDVVGAIANEAGVPGGLIGKVVVVARKTFVGMPRRVAEQLLIEHPTLVLRGREVRLSLARPRPTGPPGKFRSR